MTETQQPRGTTGMATSRPAPESSIAPHGSSIATADLRVTGETILYRLFDVGYEIRLDQALERLASSAPERPRPSRGEAQAIQIPNPPVSVTLGIETVTLAGVARQVEFSARLFDFGVISLRARIVAAPGTPWSELAALGAAAGSSRAWSFFEPCRDRLLQRIAPAIARPALAPVTEEYMVFRVHRLEDAEGRAQPPDALSEDSLARLLLGESRPLATDARHTLLSPRFSYFEDDLTVLTWSAALVVEPDVEDTDVQYVLEFANAQLLELRYHDSQLDDEVPKLYADIAAARRGFHLLGRRYSRVLSLLQTRVADATEAVERVENALKVTDDVFLARIYAAAVEIFRGPTWRRGIDRKMEIVRDAYTMMNAESQARRTEVLELIIIVLIVLEIVIGVFRP